MGSLLEGRLYGLAPSTNCTSAEVQLGKYRSAIVHILAWINVDTQRAFVDTLFIALFFIAEDDGIAHINIQGLVG